MKYVKISISKIYAKYSSKNLRSYGKFFATNFGFL